MFQFAYNTTALLAMMKSHLRSRICFVVCLLALGTLAACQVPFITQWVTPEEADPVTEIALLTWHASADEEAHVQARVEQFHAANPTTHVTIQWTSEYARDLSTALATDSMPDLFALDSFRVPDLLAAGALAPLTMSSADGTTQSTDFAPVLRNAFSTDDQLTCLPKEVRTLALLYNKTLFDAAGLAYPDETWTWDNLRSAAETIATTTNPFYTTYGIVLSPDFARWLPFLYQAGGSVTDAAHTTMTINSPQALTALNFYLNLLLDGHAITPREMSSRWNGEAFGKGRIGMTIEGNWIVPYLAQEFSDLNYGIAPLPAGPQGRATVAFATCYAVSARSTHPESAWQLATHLISLDTTSSEFASGQTMPARTSQHVVWLAQHPAQAPFIDGLQYAHIWQFGPGFQAVVEAVNSSMQQVLDAEITSEELLRVAETVGSELLAR